MFKQSLTAMESFWIGNKRLFPLQPINPSMHGVAPPYSIFFSGGLQTYVCSFKAGGGGGATHYTYIIMKKKSSSLITKVA